MPTHPKCGRSWAAAGAEHCPACCETFNSQLPGDMHRVGYSWESQGPDRRRCLSVEEMLARGMAKNSRGLWVSKLWDTPSHPDHLAQRREGAFP